jgi:hypothetical protein
MPNDITKTPGNGCDDEQRIEVGARLVRIRIDDDPESPRAWSNVGTMICWHRRYRLGDRHGFADPERFQAWLAEHPAIVLPLYLYDHSGITMNTTGFSCPWDSGQVGFIYVTLADARKEYVRQRLSRRLRARIEDGLRQEVATYDDYLCGRVYGFIVEDKDGETIDSCWGFYGLDQCLEQAMAAARDS